MIPDIEATPSQPPSPSAPSTAPMSPTEVMRNYNRLRGMIKRCTNPNDNLYHRYGGRGITVCERWASAGGFERFMEDMGPCPPGMTIDRIDNNGPYSPENCRWADRKTQNRNTGRNRTLTINGVSKCLEEWAAESGVDSHAIAKRLRRMWPAEDAVFTPLNPPKRTKARDRHSTSTASAPYARKGGFIIPNKPNHKPQLQGPMLQIANRERLLFVDGVCKPMVWWLRESTVPANVAADRLKRGWDAKSALFTPALGIGKKRPGIRKAVHA